MSSSAAAASESPTSATPRAAYVFVAALALAFGLRPLVYGAVPAEIALHLVFLAGWIVLPGWLVVRAWRFARGDWLAELALGWTIGQALHALVFFALRTRGLTELSVFEPLVPLAFAALGWKRARVDGERARVVDPGAPWSTFELGVLFALCLVAIERTTLFSAVTWWKEFDRDLFFHAGNAAEFANRWPMCDPRNAASGFNYHVYAYAPAAAARELFGIPTTETMLRLGASAVPVLLVLMLATAGRAFGGSARAGLVAAALVALASDAGYQLARVFGSAASALNVNSFLGFGVYNSPSTVLGLVYATALALVLKRWFDEGEHGGPKSGPSAARTLLLALFGFAAAGAKGSVMPVVLAGLGLVFLVLLVHKRPGAKRAFLAALVLALAAALPTFALTQGEASYGSAMFRFAPLDTVRSSGLFAALAKRLGHTSADAPSALGWLALPLWTIFYFALAGAGALAWYLRERRTAGAAELYLACAALSATVVALALGAPGYSQLFFLYTGQLGLVLLAAKAFTQGLVPHAWRVPIAIVFGLPFLASAMVAIAGEVRRDLAQRDPLPLSNEYRAGLVWIREHTPHESIVVAGHNEMLESVHAERASFHETELYAPTTHARGWKRGPVGWVWESDYDTAFPGRKSTRDSFFTHPSADNIAALRAQLGRDVPLYAIFDKLTTRYGGELGSWFEIAPVGPAPEFAPGLMTLEFENAALRVYRIEPAR
jgi:hypothetical protein